MDIYVELKIFNLLMFNRGLWNKLNAILPWIKKLAIDWDRFATNLWPAERLQILCDLYQTCLLPNWWPLLWPFNYIANVLQPVLKSSLQWPIMQPKWDGSFKFLNLWSNGFIVINFINDSTCWDRFSQSHLRLQHVLATGYWVLRDCMCSRW